MGRQDGGEMSLVSVWSLASAAAKMALKSAPEKTIS